ncbi:hypothetical protein Bbelb_164240 [Branchiostoma belcheri]|nr:hypothetical protein Bbelb_164240 [Branchiostoma belcheri]
MAPVDASLKREGVNFVKKGARSPGMERFFCTPQVAHAAVRETHLSKMASLHGREERAGQKSRPGRRATSTLVGIIQTLKLNYRKRQLRRILQELQDDKEATGTQVTKWLTIMEAIQFVESAWQETAEDTIQKCFKKARFCQTGVQITYNLSDDTSIRNATRQLYTNVLPFIARSCGSDTVSQPVLTQRDQKRIRLVWTLQTIQQLFGCNFGELAAIDEDLSTCDTEVRDWEKNASTLLGELQDTDKGECSRPEHTGERDALWNAETLWYLTMFLCVLWDLSVFLSAILCTCPVPEGVACVCP